MPPPMSKFAQSIPPPQDEFLRTYRRGFETQGGYDEMLDATGGVRAHWQPFVDELATQSPAELAARSQRIDRRIRRTGITFDIFADPTKSTQQWRLDLAPIIFSAQEWTFIERALNQRARLFDAVVSDIYGAQTTLREGLIPPDLVFADRSYIKSCRNVLPPSAQITFYAADLARGSDGRWRVIDNHTETPAGLGFALANRVVHSETVGEVFNHCNAIRLAEHFQRLRSLLSHHAGRDSPRIALLTPGAHHPDYFSHGYLARYLGYLLVEGSDLIVKGTQVYLKTLEGLREIDLIVRCADGRFVDPLELEPNGFLGPAGLLRANRKSPNLMVNTIGSGVAQNRGLGECLPALAQKLLGEDLLIEDASRRWLGSDAIRRYVLDNLDKLVIRKVQEGTGRPGQAALGEDPAQLSDAKRRVIAEDIALHGASLVAEESVTFSSSPSVTENGLVSRSFAVRVFVARTEDGYRVMPGGLAMTVDPKRAVALSAPDGHTRDVWVLSETRQTPHVSLWRPTVDTARIQRSQRVIQSRVADDLFWLGRYSERLDWNLRVMRSALRRDADDNGPSTGRYASRLCLEAVLTRRDDDPDYLRQIRDARELPDLIDRMRSDERANRSILTCCKGLHRVAYLTRDRLSLEAWRALGRFDPADTWMRALNAAGDTATLLDVIDDGLAGVSAFAGLLHENMTRNFGWSFLDMGRRLERAFQLSEGILTLFVPNPGGEEEQSRLLLLLELADSFITYRSRYRLDPLLPLVLDLLLLDETNPRSLAFQLAAMSRHMEALPSAPTGRGLAEDRRLLLELSTSIRLADVEAVAKKSGSDMLADLMRLQLRLLPEFSNKLARHYFSLSDDTPHRVHTRSSSAHDF